MTQILGGLIFLAFFVVGLICAENFTNPQHGRRVVCYLASWSIYTGGDGRFEIKDAEPAVSMCTHVVYLYGTLNENPFAVTNLDLERDIGMRGYADAVGLKKKHPHIKLMLSVGGWNDGSEKYSRMCQNEKTRSDFIKSVVDHLKKYSFDGIDLNWQFPGIRGGSSHDKENLVLLAKELREELDKHGKLFSIAVSCMKHRIDAGTDGKKLSQYAHFLNVLTYEYHGYWDRKVGFSAPLYSNDEFNIDFTIQYYLNMGVDPDKLNLGLSSYFMTYLLEKSNDTMENVTDQPVKTGSFKVPFSGVDGFITYYELCMELDNPGRWKIIMDSSAQAPVAIQGEKVVSFETAESYALKVKYAMDKKLGGIIYYGLEKDDFHAKCNSSKGVKFPMLHSIDSALNNYAHLVFDDINENLKKQPAHFFWNGMKG